MEKQTTVGISFSSRMLGIVVFKGNEILDYSVKLLKQKWSIQKLQNFLSVITDYIITYKPGCLTVVTTPTHHQTTAHKAITSSLQEFIKKEKVPLKEFPIAELYTAFASIAHPTRASLIRRLVLFYPELEQFEEKELFNKHKYYIKLFEAVGSVLLYQLHEQDKQG